MPPLSSLICAARAGGRAQVNVLEGLWGFRVNNPHVGGLALRTHPSNSEDFSFHLEDEQVRLLFICGGVHRGRRLRRASTLHAP